MRCQAVVATLMATLLIALTACDNPQSPASGDEEAIDVFGPYRGVEADNFAASLRGFEEATGIAVNYTGSADFVSDLRQRVESGLDAPDIAVIHNQG
jgi:alpha-glucoside transport system substrate-binding protein